MNIITANELRTRGLSDIERILQDETEVAISVGGRPRYVVIDIARYDHLRECEIHSAWQQASADLAAGDYRHENVDEHIARIRNEISGEVD